MSMPQTPALERDQADMIPSPIINSSADSPPMSPTQEPADKQRTTGPIGLAGIHPIVPTDTPSDIDIPDNYVSHTIAKTKYLPPVTWKNLIYNIQWISFLAITITPSIAIYGMFTTDYSRKTLIWS